MWCSVQLYPSWEWEDSVPHSYRSLSVRGIGNVTYVECRNTDYFLFWMILYIIAVLHYYYWWRGSSDFRNYSLIDVKGVSHFSMFPNLALLNCILTMNDFPPISLNIVVLLQLLWSRSSCLLSTHPAYSVAFRKRCCQISQRDNTISTIMCSTIHRSCREVSALFVALVFKYNSLQE